MTHPEDVLKTSLQDIFKTFWRRLENFFAKRLEEILKTYWRHLCKTFQRCLKDVSKSSWRRMTKTKTFVLIQTSWGRLLKTNTKDIFKTSSRRLLYIYINIFIYIPSKYQKNIRCSFKNNKTTKPDRDKDPTTRWNLE